MALSPMLFIGLGGTGGKVLGVIQNAIINRLNGAGIHEVPEAWQFLHIDVAAVRDAHEDGQPFALRPSDFFGLTIPGDTYSREYNALEQSINDAADLQYALKSWAPQPGEVAESVADGAQKLRAVGRVVGLSNLKELKGKIRERLTAAASAKPTELTTIAEKLGISTNTPGKAYPFVVVISSIAGGSGAGLTAEVLDLLKSEGVNHPMVDIFTPEVYSAMDGSGDVAIPPNSLYAAMELVAADWDPGDRDDYRNSRHALFGSQDVVAAQGRGGAEGYLLIGSSTQKGAVFRRPQDVYRVLGRMYAELVFDVGLFQALDAYVMTNLTAAKAGANNRLGLAVGDGKDQPNLLGLGFGKLSIGREFFLTYAHQRLLNLASTRLLEAHLLEPSAAEGRSHEELLAQSVERHYPRFVTDLRLRELDSPFGPNDDILNRVSIRKDPSYRDGTMARFIGAVTSDVQQLAHGLLGKRISWADAVKAAHNQCMSATRSILQWPTGSSYRPHPRDAGPEVIADVVAEAHGMIMVGIKDVETSLVDSLADTLPHFCAEVGLPVTIRMLEKLRQDLRQASNELSQQSLQRLAIAKADLRGLELPPANTPRAFAADDYQTTEDIAGRAASVVDEFVNAVELEITSRFTKDLAQGVIDPWITSLRNTFDALQRGVTASRGKATLRDTWPTETGQVPDSLRPSEVEFILDDIAAFPSMFLDQITLRMPARDDLADHPELQRQDALANAIRDIITGQRDEGGSSGLVRKRWTRDTVVVTTQQWTSAVRDEVNSRPLRLDVHFNLGDLERRINEWLTDPHEATYSFLNCTLRQYLAPDPATVGEEQVRRRHDRMVDQFSQLLDAVQPFVKLNLDLLTEVHGQTAHDARTIISELDVPQLDGDRQARLGTDPLRSRLAAAAVQRRVPDLSFSGAPSPSASLLSVSALPFHPIVVESLMGPIVGSGSAVLPSGSRHRRSRPLPETLPLAPDAQQQLLLGLFVGRMLGYASYSSHAPDLLKVRTRGRWQELRIRGVRSHHRLLAPYDLPGRFLESLLPAMLNAYSLTKLEPLAPFVELFRLGEQCRSYQSPIVNWIRDGKGSGESDDPFLLVGGDTVGDRLGMVRACIQDFNGSLTHLREEASQLGDWRELPTMEVMVLTLAALDKLSGSLDRGFDGNGPRI